MALPPASCFNGGMGDSGPDFTIELKAMRRFGKGIARKLVCGIDEAGRGPWAGPVVAAAVVLDPKSIPEGLNDSKKLSEAQREALFAPIVASARVGIGIAEPLEKFHIFGGNARISGPSDGYRELQFATSTAQMLGTSSGTSRSP